MSTPLASLFARDAVGDADLSSLPDDQRTAVLRTKATELRQVTEDVERLTNELELLTKRRTELETRILPDLMDQFGVDSLGLPDANADLIVRDYVHASIKKDLPPEEREAAFAELEAHDG